MNVADDSIFRPFPNHPRQAQTNGGLNLIYHGTVFQRYGLDLVLQAMARLRQEMADTHFTILGVGNEMEALKRLASELNLNDQVTFHCNLRPAEELPELIGKADVGVVAYRNDRFTDGLVPTKLMEYAALGLPSIAARTTAIARYFDDSMVEFFTPGSLEDLAHAIARLYHVHGRLEELAKGIQKFNQSYNWGKFGVEYVALLERLRTR